jgi:hypothetical protein
VKFASLIRDLALIRSPERKDEIARLSKGQLARLPEATIVAVVHGWFELKADGHSDADILREIEGRREKVYGEEALPGDLTLVSYTRYRLRLEHPGQERAHDATFVMQAVHRASQVIGATYGEETEGATARGPRTGATLILGFAAALAVTQGVIGYHALRYGDAPLPDWMGALLLVVPGVLLVGAIGYAGGTTWGRALLVPGLFGQIALCVAMAVAIAVDGIAPLSTYIFPSLPAAFAIAALAYLRRRQGGYRAQSPD